MKVIFLGTGTSTGVPQLGCGCEVCKSTDPRDWRLRTSVRIEIDGKVLMIDCSPDFRQQVLAFPFEKIDGILLTHEHYDHVGGIDDLRPFSVFGPVDLYMEERLENALRERLPYCFSGYKYSGVPNLAVRRISADEDFQIGTVTVTPIRVMHYRLPILGFRIRNFAYLTDVKTMEETELKKLEGIDTLVISALRKTEHISHQTLDQALKIIDMVKPTTSYLTHMSHEIGMHADLERELPDHVLLAYDGLQISV
ncbi:phosphoribosyl 1,2-cyclic phosphate phosphodiesterase [Porphyromonadaceae bacterium NLAE-zl-C104]|uniref:MBL fold metallo-hydrolase n=1 Tax=Proteiniphilum sp. TaxID=1926877 RepID=UPI00089D5949|nr:MBL fold metallo-hydrolase [Proteiniphilum sp.]MDY9918926.1 MBL fold metallo-hydrolase [Proteiniphilum sp.]SEA40847.1 phosphoribosyl 1,2-cyclic phosphate phosphodiesterase [Porphyromonadaceae bacterium KH3R12]SFS50577.1 phosphoribosyl 1,2-cyclic phosphate phosphodiesterase [Porphyromonadaceae bacterium NLAE-zl-C104]